MYEDPCPEPSIATLTNGSKLLESTIETLSLGADEIYVQLEGKSVQTVIARQDYRCGRYYAALKVPIDGKYRLKVFRTRTNFTAISQEKREFPAIRYEVMCDQLIKSTVYKSTGPCMQGDGKNVSFHTTLPPHVILIVSTHNPKHITGHWISNDPYPFYDSPAFVGIERGVPLYTYLRTNSLLVPSGPAL